MKQPLINSEINIRIEQEKVGAHYVLNNFEFNYLLPFYDEHRLPIILYLPDACFEIAIKYMSKICTANNIVFIPPDSRFLHEPENLQLSYNAHVRRSKELLATGVGGVTFVLCAWSGKSIPIVGDESGKSLHIMYNSSFDDCVEFLSTNGYNNVDVVCEPGEYCLRGGIIDIFPSSRRRPVRINFLGEEVSLQVFDPNTQIATIDMVKYSIPPSIREGLSSISSSLSNCFYSLYFNIKDFYVHNEIIINFSDFYTPITYNMFCEMNLDNLSVHTDDRLFSAGVLMSAAHAFLPSWFLNKTPPPPMAPNRGFVEPLNLINIKKGDYLVHRDYGVGRFVGLFINDSNGGNEQEFVSIKYDNDEIIRVDVSRLELINYFAANDSENITLDSLQKRNIWSRKKAVAKRAAEEAAAMLLNLYVKRSDLNRKPAPLQKDLEIKFINDFPFIETVDQKTAWEEISQDMSLSTPMDRLLCGDVGFGKTEIAMRAAFRCVLGGKRVVVLAPTTLLANQHFASFNNRMNAHGILIDVVSRLQSKKGLDLIKTKILNNNNDVLVGTHSLLNDHLYLANIGLLIIDEEHRFGVSQKEKIKQFKTSIDVLSMSATPIPRSLNLALSGIYSISLLQTPPLMRFPIITHIKLFDENIIRDAILFEVSRGGQVYFVHNNIQSIKSCSDRLRKLLPRQNIQNIHGKEAARTIENKMEKFISGSIDVLVATSIIEVGIDVPNANCIIINNAHLFGLSQLYQMRGRVGRSYRQAYAYLFLPTGYKTNAQANKRLKSITENVKLGSGYNISRSDMEIRGAGSLFGFKQSGGGGSVGYEMYLRLIQRTFHGSGKLNSNFTILPEDVNIEIYSKRLIPKDYVFVDDLRLSFYKNIVNAMTFQELDAIVYNVSNRFGAPPTPFNNLIKESKLKLLSAMAGIVSIQRRGCGLVCSLGEGLHADYFSAIYDLFENFFLKKGLDYHLLPSKNNLLSLCVHTHNTTDKYSLLSNFLNKFNNLKKC